MLKATPEMGDKKGNPSHFKATYYRLDPQRLQWCLFLFYLFIFPVS